MAKKVSAKKSAKGKTSKVAKKKKAPVKAKKKPVKKAKAKPASKAKKKTVAKKVAPKKTAKAKPVAKKMAVKPAPKPVMKSKPVAAPPKKSTTLALLQPKLPPVISPPIARNNVIFKKAKSQVDNRTRYSDSELKEFRELINAKLAEASRDYELLKNTLSHKDDHGTDDTSPTFKLLEDGSDVLSKEETAQLAARQEKYIQNLKNALIRIENKTYGICRITGKLIPKERLRSVPHATLSIDAKMGQHN